jgi:hypothetical protein
MLDWARKKKEQELENWATFLSFAFFLLGLEASFLADFDSRSASSSSARSVSELIIFLSLFL